MGNQRLTQLKDAFMEQSFLQPIEDLKPPIDPPTVETIDADTIDDV